MDGYVGQTYTPLRGAGWSSAENQVTRKLEQMTIFLWPKNNVGGGGLCLAEK